LARCLPPAACLSSRWAQVWGSALAATITARNARVVEAVEFNAVAHTDPATIEVAQIASTIMAMTNIYYRATHMADDLDLSRSACIAQFGSGGAWPVFDGDKLAVTKTWNADTLLTEGHAALLTCDVWEHSYYIDYRNLRPKYVDAFPSYLVNWEAVTSRYELAISGQ